MAEKIMIEKTRGERKKSESFRDRERDEKELRQKVPSTVMWP